MKKQFHKIKIAAENLSRSSKSDIKDDELIKIEKQVDKYKDVLEKIHKKFSQSAGSEQDREKRIKKIHEHRLAQSLEESYKELPEELILNKVIRKCGELEKTIAYYIVDNEIQTENAVTKKLKTILDTDIQQIATHKRTVSKYVQDYNSVKKAYENAQRSNENSLKINQLKQQVEDCEQILEKERDCWAAEMFSLIAKDEDIAYCVRDFVVAQKAFYEKALRDMELFLYDINTIVKICDKKRIFGVSLHEHLRSTNRKISKVIELCVCCLMERGLCEEGLLRVGCAGTKLKRMKNAIDAQYVTTPLPSEYQDVHVIAGLLKSYLRELPEPLLTFRLYDDFIQAAQRPTENERKSAILNAVNQLPDENYDNLKYLTRFLWCLYQKHEQNKMSSQNIAIVISPNILWPPENNSKPIDYAGQVNSSAAVNTIVELLVSDWDFFFGGEVEFYLTVTRDNLFIENGPSGYVGERDGGHFLPETIIQSSNQTHSRSSSHDTSRILLNINDGSSMIRSHSNDSLSDTSSPTHVDSPKLPARRKHNKPSAPTPPHKINPMTLPSNNPNEPANEHISLPESISQINLEQHSITVVPNITNQPTLHKCDGFSQTPPISIATGQTVCKPDKPPRPAPVECSTLNRATYKNRSVEKLHSSNKPVALPRTILNVTKSTENLSTQSDDNVQLRDKPEIREKPVIPERPVTLMRPTSFRNDPASLQDFTKNPDSNGNSSIKKASSFRVMSTSAPSAQQSSSKSVNSHTNNSNTSLSSNNGGSSSTNTGHNHKTTLERAQIYSVDKQQVSIIDVQTTAEPTTVTTNTITMCATKSPVKPENPLILNENPIISSKEFICMESASQSLGQVPPSPRGFDPRIKRPQIPAPPPPTNRRKSDGGLGDSTHL